jgi:hypothetical protein
MKNTDILSRETKTELILILKISYNGHSLQDIVYQSLTNL